MDRRLCWALWCLLPGCGSGSESSSLPADAEEMRSYLKSGVTLVMPRLGGAGGVFPLALNPGAPGRVTSNSARIPLQVLQTAKKSPRVNWRLLGASIWMMLGSEEWTCSQ